MRPILQTIFEPSPLTKIHFVGKTVWIKRDDQLNLQFPGNKWRKLVSTFQKLQNSQYSQIVSCGGNQSNAMLAIARLASSLGLTFTYFTRPLSKTLREQPQGNLKTALNLGMRVTEDIRQWHVIEEEWTSNTDSSILFIPPGVCHSDVREGVYQLGDELKVQIEQQLDSTAPIAIVLPSGTGVTSFFLSQYFNQERERIRVFTVSTAIPFAQLKSQFQTMKNWENIDNEGEPTILETKRRYDFAVPDQDLKKLYCALKKKGIEFDLIYAPVTWRGMLDNWNELKSSQIIYIHTGGVEGNETQLRRYASCSFGSGSVQNE